MAVDAMEVLITHPDVDTFLLVAGDGDYSPLVQRLREWGKRVVGIGTRASASSRLVAVCSEQPAARRTRAKQPAAKQPATAAHPVRTRPRAGGTCS
jgi:uncharacterized LabA/DUF88 family protein